MINLRKIFYLPSPKQTITVLEDMDMITHRCNKLAAIERKEQVETQRAHNRSCPRCRAKSDKIVNRIASVEGVGNVRGGFFSNVNGATRIDTVAVNHCNECGHEWKKFKTKVVTGFGIRKVVLNYLGEIITDPERHKVMSWKTEAIEVFDGCCAEAIYQIQKKQKLSMRNFLTLRVLRKNYKSVFNK